MPPIQLLSLLALADGGAPADATSASQSVSFARIDPGTAARPNERIYRVGLRPGESNAGTLVVVCENREIIGASFEPALVVDGNAIVRAAGNSLCE